MLDTPCILVPSPRSFAFLDENPWTASTAMTSRHACPHPPRRRQRRRSSAVIMKQIITDNVSAPTRIHTPQHSVEVCKPKHDRFRKRSHTQAFFEDEEEPRTASKRTCSSYVSRKDTRRVIVRTNTPPLHKEIAWRAPAVHDHSWEQQAPQFQQSMHMHPHEIIDGVSQFEAHHRRQQRLKEQYCREMQRRQRLAMEKRKAAIKASDERLKRIQQKDYIFKENGDRDYQQEIVAFVMGL